MKIEHLVIGLGIVLAILFFAGKNSVGAQDSYSLVSTLGESWRSGDMWDTQLEGAICCEGNVIRKTYHDDWFGVDACYGGGFTGCRMEYTVEGVTYVANGGISNGDWCLKALSTDWWETDITYTKAVFVKGGYSLDDAWSCSDTAGGGGDSDTQDSGDTSDTTASDVVDNIQNVVTNIISPSKSTDTNTDSNTGYNAFVGSIYDFFDKLFGWLG